VIAAVLAQARAPYEAPDAGIFHTPCLTPALHLGGQEVCVNREVIYMFLAALIVVVLFALAASRSKMIPRGVQTFVEMIVAFVREQIVLQVIGSDGLVWVPLLTAMFAFILVGNLFEVIPGIQFPVNSRMAIPAMLAVMVWVIFNVVGFKEHKLGYLKNVLFPPGVPKGFYILLTPIEFASVFVLRPFTLSVRLLANMMAGHLLLSVFFLGTLYMLGNPITIAFSVVAFPLSVGLVAFEILVAVLQAYIFTILTAVYIGGALHPEH
jgi:F-type H+-transporting ATPase subunit a